MRTTLVAALIAGAASLPTWAWAATVTVTDAWARATLPGQPVSAAYMRIRASADARLVRVSSPAALRVETHEMKMDGDVMRMRELKTIELPKGKTVSLEPGGLHIMLMNLKKPIAAGDIVLLALEVESGGKRQTVEVKAVARASDGSAAQPHPH